MCTRLRLVNFTLLDEPNEVLPHAPLAGVRSWMSGRWQGNHGMQTASPRGPTQVRTFPGPTRTEQKVLLLREVVLLNVLTLPE